ncbi:MAG: monovalent cation/H(+) antiporter subunit G [Chloroflexota bacterium]
MLCLIFIGMVLMLIAAIGIVRMPDLYLRNSVSSKGATLGVTALMLATVLYFDELGTSSRAFAVILFMLLTAPIAAHMLGRAAYRSHVPFWSKTYIDKEISHLHMESDRASR